LIGLALLWLAVVYLALTHPLLPGWAWGLLAAGLFLWLAGRAQAPGLLESGVLLLGWGTGAMLADYLGLRALKLVGVGAALWALGTRKDQSELVYLGAAVAAAGVLVGLFEVGAAPWVAGVLILLGVYFLLSREARGPETTRGDREFERRYRALLRWRLSEAERRGVRVDEVLSDEELARIARAESPEELEALLGPHDPRLAELSLLLFEAKRVP